MVLLRGGLGYGFAVAGLVVLSSAGGGRGQDNTPLIEPGGRVRVNSLLRMAVPQPDAETGVQFSITDPWGWTIHRGITFEDKIAVLTRDWADGAYTIHFANGPEVPFRIDTAYYDTFRARGAQLLREVDRRRNPDDWPPQELFNITNLLQKWMMYEVYFDTDDAADEKLAGAERAIGLRTHAGMIRLLGSGAADHSGYDRPYRPSWRERTSVFMPPNAVFDFAANAERKLKRWGYGPADVEHVFISHSHADHFDAKAILAFAAKRKAAKLGPLRVYSGKAAIDQLEAAAAERKTPAPIETHVMQPGGTLEAGELRVTAVRAHHDPKATPLCYIVRWHNATAYYGTDTGYPRADAMELLLKERFDVFLHEVTFVVAGEGEVHMDIEDLRRLVGKLRRAGVLDAYSRVITMHQSKLGPPVVPDYSYLQAVIGFEFGFDGMPIPLVYTEPIEAAGGAGGR
jgi:L-ascorbate metabolism protein UlaG (beta-lactamase superfamily)